MTKFEKFQALHKAKDLFILPNAWNVESAIIFQKNNFSAVATSSAAVAATLGYGDGEKMPFTEYMLIISRMAASINVPLTVDLEMGYGTSDELIYQNIEKLLAVGVVGINIEDSVITKGVRSLKEPNSFGQTITFIKDKLSRHRQSLFINVRCDTYLLDVKDKKDETSHRIQLYEKAGADGIFLPFITEEDDIVKAVTSTKLPLNVMAIAGLPATPILQRLGVRRISMGPFLHSKSYNFANELAKNVIESNSIQSIL
ncbi:MAG: isocitrate lyase/phosphoenolpyruvate mutase family protein [Cytophagia bacterium]|nr:isocitrate lyase/phosphoenolpyruvate mutase family protein [Cytophagia bacterium]NBW34558.1 isocitrate lyase/phosphoenolpyruvate mutase family protein [Cytophagia bacterium]